MTQHLIGTERKFLVPKTMVPQYLLDDQLEDEESNLPFKETESIRQGYLTTSDNCVVRIRHTSTNLYDAIELTVKSKIDAYSCKKLETEIDDFVVGDQMLQLCPNIIEKMRYFDTSVEGFIVSIDDFSLPDVGLGSTCILRDYYLVEFETIYTDADIHNITYPEWMTDDLDNLSEKIAEVTGMTEFSNTTISILIGVPYEKLPD